MGYTARLRISRSAARGGDVLPGDFVTLISGNGLGLVESVSGDVATVFNLERPGHREIISTWILMRACEQ